MLALTLAACAPSADDPVNRQTEWRPPSRDYVVRYLDPPWEIARELDEGVMLRIQSNAMSVAGVEGGPGKFELSVTPEPGIPPTRANAERASYAAMGHVIVAEPRMITTQQGVTGIEFVTRRQDERLTINHRVVYLPLDTGRVLRLEFQSTPAVDSAEVTEMIRLVGIGPEEP